jgi:hypothetical protein
MKLSSASWPSDSLCASTNGVSSGVRERAIAAAGPDQVLVEVAHRVLEPDVSTR